MLIVVPFSLILLLNLPFYSSAKPYQDVYGKQSKHTVYNSLTSLIKPNSTAGIYPKIDKDERTLIVPTIKPSPFPKKKHKRKPNRTVQKIIKKTKKPQKTIFSYQVTIPQTVTHKHELKMETPATTQASQKKKSRKYSSKYVRYTMPFHKLAKNRIKRGATTTRDLYILEDLDEVQFLNTEDDVNVINSHVKKYW